MESGQWPEALRDIELALQVEPNRPEWLLGRARALQGVGRFQEAVLAIEKTRMVRGDDGPTLVLLAKALLLVPKLEAALDAATYAMELDLSIESPFCISIEILRQLGRHEEAEINFYRAREFSEFCPDCLDYLGRSLHDRGMPDRAIWCWQQALKVDPDRPGLYCRLGEVLAQQGRLEEARQAFLAQLCRHPDDLKSLELLADLLSRMGRAAEAGARFAQVLELNPRHAHAHYRLGELALTAGHIEAAEARFLRARELDAALPGPNLGLAKIARRRNAPSEARRLLQAEMKLEHPFDEQVLDLAGTLIDCGLPVISIGLLSSLIEKGLDAGRHPPQLARAYLFRAVAHLTCGRCEEGIGDCRSCLRLQPEHFAARQNLILAYLAQGRLARARVCLRALQRLHPNDSRLGPLRSHVRRAVWGHVLARFKPGVRRRRLAESRPPLRSTGSIPDPVVSRGPAEAKWLAGHLKTLSQSPDSADQANQPRKA